MANITVTDLVVNSAVEADLLSNSGSSIRDLSESELALQGGGLFRRRRLAPVLPVPEVSNWPTPVDPSFDGFFPIVANFYI